ncbi:MAG TPA: DUF2892 domain-containing protein [Candidatus Limnocylindria bacterium]|nr:DUF2892 domain-containing protein [Candidatus Limnocylindria bacterium]
MPTNMTTIDRLVRGLFIAPVLVAFALLAVGPTSMVGALAIAVAAILLLTAIVGFCPIYAILGIGRKPRTVAH